MDGVNGVDRAEAGEVATAGRPSIDDDRIDEARRVLERLRRIQRLDREQAPASRLLDELRELVGEAEAWARLEGDERARAAAVGLAEAITTIEEVEPEALAVN
jgi:DNA-directed RNA polymerase subunit F